MRCTSCGYSLWNLRTRQCPECGGAFRPSDFRFVPNTVQFRCPHCEQAYYGTDENGLPSPRTFDCASCHTRIDVDQMILLPVAGVAEEDTQAGSMPWLERARRGRMRGLLASVAMALFSPVKLMRGVPANAPTGDLLAFGAIMCLLSLLLGILPLLWYAGWDLVFGWYDMGMTMIFGAGALASLLAAIGFVPVLGLVAHAALRVTGGCQHPIDRTFQAMGAGAGASVACAVPCIGWFFGWAWWAVSATIMLAVAQRVHPARAALAVMLLPFVLFASLVSMVVMGHYIERSMYYSDWEEPTHQITTSLSQYGWDSSGEHPHHAIELSLNRFFHQHLLHEPFCHPETRTTAADVPLLDSTLDSFMQLSRQEKVAFISSVLEQFPPNVIAHRLGDFLFVAHGAQVNSYDSNLWLVVMLPDPDINGVPGTSTPVEIGHADLTLQRTTYGELAELLKAQNAYRATIGLPPLPDLLAVRHGAPALSDGTGSD